MRHIMIDLFASPMGPSCPNLVFTIFSPTSKTNLLRHFIFALKTIYSPGCFKRGPHYLASRSWDLCASLLVDTTIAPADTKLCEDADVSRRSFHYHYIIAVYQSKHLYIHYRGQPHIPPASHQHILQHSNFTSI